MVLIALLFVPCMIVAITVALPVLLFLAAVVAMVFVWYQSVVLELQRRLNRQTPNRANEVYRDAYHDTNATATTPTRTNTSTRGPQQVSGRHRSGSSLSNNDRPATRIVARNENVMASLLIPQPPTFPIYATPKLDHHRMVRSWSSTSRLAQYTPGQAISAGAATTPTLTTRSSSASALYRRECDFELTPRRRVRFG